MSDLLYPAFQKFYSALKCIEGFDKEKDFFDNISSLDKFFSEFRSVTFVLQKSLAHTEYYSLYECYRDEYLSGCKWFVQKRNETIKQQPFQLVKQIEITVYFPFGSLPLESKTFTVENDTELSTHLDSIKKYLIKINENEVFFSVIFSFYENGTNEDLFDNLDYGIFQMKTLLNKLYNEIRENSKVCEILYNKINNSKLFNFSKEMFLINDYVYYPKENSFERSERITAVIGDNKGTLIPNRLENTLFKDLGDDYFISFVLINIVLETAELMPTIMMIYNDETFTIEPFNGSLKTTIYRKINEVAKLILTKRIKEVYFMITYATYVPNAISDIPNTTIERYENSINDYLVFMKVDSQLNESELSFNASKMSDKEYVFSRLKEKKEKIEFGKNNMLPIINAFKTIKTG